MADPDYSTMTDAELLAAAHAAGVDTQAPKTPTDAAVTPAPEQSGLSTAEKVGLGAAGAGTAALVLKFPELRTALENLAARANIAKTEVPVWKQAGLRTAEDAPIARNLAGSSGREALQLHAANVSRTIAANEAGIPAAQAPWLSQDILADAKREPSAVFGRVANTLPTGPLSEQAQNAISTAGLPDTGRMSKGSPQAQAQIEDLRQQLLAPGKMFTGQQVVNEMRGLRQEGFANVASDDVSNQQLGRAQLAMARAITQHINDSIPAGADVTPEQFAAASKTLAKNATIQQALRGNDVDLQVLARIQRADPQLLDGGTKMLADFASTHPEVATLPSMQTRYNPPSAARDVQDISLKNPASWIRPALGGLARRALVGDPDAAIAQANQMFPARDAMYFSPPPTPPPPKFGGYLPSPSMINAGGGATTPNSMEALGLTPDVRAAGLQHPATARLQTLRDHLAGLPERSAEPIDFQGPQKWGDFSIAPQEAPPAAQEGVPFENVLEQGGTQGKPVAGIQKGYRPAPQSPKGPNMRTPPGALELTEFTPFTPSAAQMNFRNQQAADRLRKVAGDLSAQGPGGNTGDPLERLRAALMRRERGYADGGEVRNSSSPASPGVGGALKDAIAAVKDYLVDTPRRRLQAQREGYENQVINAEGPAGPSTPTTDNYASGGTIADIAQREQSLEDISRSLSDLVSEHESPPPAAMAGGGRVELAQKLADFLERISNAKAAQDAEIAAKYPARPRPPLVQATEDPLVTAATRPPAPPVNTPPASLAPVAPPQDPFQPDFLLRKQAMADGGSVDDAQSSIRKLADLARRLDNPSGTDPNAEHRARVATNLASLVYGLDAQGHPALGGRAWTSSQGGTPAGVLDALTTTPHNLVQVAKLVDKYLPGKSNPQFWDSIDPQWSQDASNRLGQLKQRLQQAAGVAPASSWGDAIADTVTDPSMVAPLGASKALDKASALRKLLSWGTGSSPVPETPAPAGAN
jgi:hypothetical protein